MRQIVSFHVVAIALSAITVLAPAAHAVAPHEFIQVFKALELSDVQKGAVMARFEAEREAQHGATLERTKAGDALFGAVLMVIRARGGSGVQSAAQAYDAALARERELEAALWRDLEAIGAGAALPDAIEDLAYTRLRENPWVRALQLEVPTTLALADLRDELACDGASDLVRTAQQRFATALRRAASRCRASLAGTDDRQELAVIDAAKRRAWAVQEELNDATLALMTAADACTGAWSVNARRFAVRGLPGVSRLGAAMDEADAATQRAIDDTIRRAMEQRARRIEWYLKLIEDPDVIKADSAAIKAMVDGVVGAPEARPEPVDEGWAMAMYPLRLRTADARGRTFAPSPIDAAQWAWLREALGIDVDARAYAANTERAVQPFVAQWGRTMIGRGAEPDPRGGTWKLHAEPGVGTQAATDLTAYVNALAQIDATVLAEDPGADAEPLAVTWRRIDRTTYGLDPVYQPAWSGAERCDLRSAEDRVNIVTVLLDAGVERERVATEFADALRVVVEAHDALHSARLAAWRETVEFEAHRRLADDPKQRTKAWLEAMRDRAGTHAQTLRAYESARRAVIEANRAVLVRLAAGDPQDERFAAAQRAYDASAFGPLLAHEERAHATFARLLDELDGALDEDDPRFRLLADARERDNEMRQHLDWHVRRWNELALDATDDERRVIEGAYLRVAEQRAGALDLLEERAGELE